MVPRRKSNPFHGSALAIFVVQALQPKGTLDQRTQMKTCTPHSDATPGDNVRFPQEVTGSPCQFSNKQYPCDIARNAPKQNSAYRAATRRHRTPRCRSNAHLKGLLCLHQNPLTLQRVLAITRKGRMRWAAGSHRRQLVSRKESQAIRRAGRKKRMRILIREGSCKRSTMRMSWLTANARP